ncbi:MAG: type II toxin-antitoxin system Phd/YefM family antitoxin [Chloroflexia bacterium]|nr:type II toxin-antitoxin system Phd/YefM family antitoxin [Chloroflexia bacterium]
MVWQLAEAKNKFSEVFTKTVEEGPQFVTRRNEEIVLISKDEYQRLIGEKPGFLEVLRSGPSLEGLDLSRDKSPMRDVEW